MVFRESHRPVWPVVMQQCRSLRLGLLLAFALVAAEAQAATELLSSIELSGDSYESRLTLEAEVEPLAESIEEMIETANLELSRSLEEDIRLPPDSLQPLASYLNLLLAELDEGAPTSLVSVELNEVQRDFLFNLYLDLVDQQLPPVEERRSYLEAAGFHYSAYLARRISELARQLGECIGAEYLADESRVNVREDLEACASDPASVTLWVNRLVVDQATEFDAAGIDIGEANQLLETQRRLYMGDPDTDIEGFPVESLLGLVQVTRNWYAASRGGGVAAPSAARSVMEELELIRRRGGISFDQLKSIAAALQKHLRRQQYFLARAYVPQQDFRAAGGDLRLAVSFGTLGEVALRDPDALHYSQDVLLNPFREYVGESVTSDIYEAYFAVNALPGVRIRSGLFEAGEQPGETQLVLDVEEQRYSVSLGSDNYGSEFTGEERVILTAEWYSPLGRGDNLSLGILQSIDPSDSTFGYFNYTLPVFGIDHELAVAYDSHEYTSIDGRLGTAVIVEGEVESYYVGYNYKWLRSKSLNVEFGLRAFERSSDTSVQLPSGADTQISEQFTEVTGGLLSTEGDVLISSLRMIAGWQATLLYAEQDEVTNFRVADSYTRLLVDLQGRMLLPWGPGADFSTLSGQILTAYTDDVLPSFEQTPLGGPFGVRAYQNFDFTADSLAFVSFDWRVDIGQHLFRDASSRNLLRLGIFAEAGYGEANAIGSVDDSWAVMSAYGLTLGYAWGDRLTLESSIAFPAYDDTSDDFTGVLSDDSYTAYFDLRYNLK